MKKNIGLTQDIKVMKTPTINESVKEEFKKKFEGYWRGEAISDEILFFFTAKLQDILSCIPEETIPVEVPHGSPYISGRNEFRKELLSNLRSKNIIQ